MLRRFATRFGWYLFGLLLLASCHDAPRKNPFDPELTPPVELSVTSTDPVTLPMRLPSVRITKATSSPRIIRAYGRRPWVEAYFEVCKATLNIERFKVRTSRGNLYGFVALRFLSFALFDYAGRRVTHSRLG